MKYYSSITQNATLHQSHSLEIILPKLRCKQIHCFPLHAWSHVVNRGLRSAISALNQLAKISGVK